MSLTKADREDIADLIAGIHAPSPSAIRADLNVGDILTKIATAALVAGVGFLITNVTGMKTQQALILQDQSNFKASLNRVEDKLEQGTKDRFTREDWKRDSQSMRDLVGSLAAKQSSLSVQLDALERKVAVMQSK